MCLLHGLMAELSVKTYIDKVLLCDLVNNSLTPPGGKNNTYCYNIRIINKLIYTFFILCLESVIKMIFYCCFYRQWALDYCLPNHIIKL